MLPIFLEFIWSSNFLDADMQCSLIVASHSYLGYREIVSGKSDQPGFLDDERVPHRCIDTTGKKV